jgi:hypothetical protein
MRRSSDNINNIDDIATNERNGYRFLLTPLKKRLLHFRSAIMGDEELPGFQAARQSSSRFSFGSDGQHQVIHKVQVTFVKEEAPTDTNP